MNKRKSLIALLLALVLVLTACGGKTNEEKPEENKGEESAEQKPEEKPEDKEDGKEKVLFTVFDKQGEGTNFVTPGWKGGNLYKVISFRGLLKLIQNLQNLILIWQQNTKCQMTV